MLPEIVNPKGNAFHARENTTLAFVTVIVLPPRPDGAGKTTDQSTKTNALYATTRDSILLQTAQIYIHTVNVKEKIRARLLFDSGSQHSYVSRDIARCLNLPIVCQESLDVKVFGSNYNQVSDYDK